MLKMVDFWAKWQAYSLAFLVENDRFLALFHWQWKGWNWLKMVDFWAKWQAYSLTFWWKMTVFWPFFIGSGKMES